MANIACLVNQTGPLYVHPEGVVRRTHFHAMAMYANLLQPRVARAEVESDRITRGESSVAMVDAIATVDESGTNWSLAIMNRHPSEAVRCTIKLGDRSIDGVFPATLLTGDGPDAYNDIDDPNRVAPRVVELTFEAGTVSLPPHSLSIIEVSMPK